MSRRFGNEADRLAAKGALARINYVIRNPEFQKDLIATRDQEAVTRLAERWGVVRIPVFSRDSYLGKLIEKGDLNTLLEEIPSYIPKVELIRAYLFKAMEGPITGAGPQFRETIELKIDLSYPLDVLEEFFKNEIRRAKMERDQVITAAGAMLPKRARLDKSDFQLKVYDLAKDDSVFTDIARRLRKPLSTVKSACVEATRKIYSIRPIEDSSQPRQDGLVLPTKKQLPRGEFDPDEHFSRCVICKKAGTADGMCPLVKAY